MGLLQFLGFRRRAEDHEVIERQAQRTKRRTTLVKADKMLNGECLHEGKVQAALDEMSRGKAETQKAFTSTIHELDEELKELLREDEAKEQGRREAAG